MEPVSRPDAQNRRQKLIILGLAVVALLTVFVLPSLVSGPWISGSPESGKQQAPSPTDVAPSTVAEKTRYRQESQAVLAKVIAVRDRLREAHVDNWGGVEFNRAMKRVESGDEQYSYGEYADSLENYRVALDELEQLEAFGQETLANAVRDAGNAVESLNINVARSAIDTALQIAPERADVQQLGTRVDRLPQLQAALESGDLARANGRLAEAQQAYREAVALDAQHQRAADSLAGIAVELVNSEFRGHMSRAFAALDHDEFAAAREAFARAEAVSPGDPAIRQGLAQVANREAQQGVNQQMAEAARLESEEAWQQALDIYQSLLETDASLTTARARLVPAQVRADLDARFETWFEDPLKLANRPSYLEAQKTLADARSIANAGPKLEGQIAELEMLLKRSTTPVDVIFESDNLTHVVLFRIADLGMFQSTSVTLRPGRYIVAGTRSGYRDVRVEFTVTGEPLDSPIVVRCEDAI